MGKKKTKKTKPKESKRKPISADFGSYLKTLRVKKKITAERLAEGLSLSPTTVMNIESGTNPAPNEQRLRLWLTILGESKRFHEAKMFLSSIRVRRTLRYTPRDECNEHIDRILDAYEGGRFNATDISLLKMIAPSEYTDT